MYKQSAQVSRGKDGAGRLLGKGANWRICFEPSGRKHDLHQQNNSGGSGSEALVVRMLTLSFFLPPKGGDLRSWDGKN